MIILLISYISYLKGNESHQLCMLVTLLFNLSIFLATFYFWKKIYEKPLLLFLKTIHFFNMVFIVIVVEILKLQFFWVLIVFIIFYSIKSVYANVRFCFLYINDIYFLNVLDVCCLVKPEIITLDYFMINCLCLIII